MSSVIAAPSVTESIYYYHNDHLGTPQVLTDGQGQVVWKADYKPFGEVELTVAAVQNNFRFPGQYFDEETGLHYNYFRNYHSWIGRYIQPDPSLTLSGNANIPFLLHLQLQSPQELNHFVYTKNNPINFADEWGLYITIPSPTDYIICKEVRDNHLELWRPFLLEKKDKMAHCALACQITREYGPWLAHNCAFWKEIWDKYDPDPKTTFNPEDFDASSAGIKIGLDKCKDCIEGCIEAGWYR